MKIVAGAKSYAEAGWLFASGAAGRPSGLVAWSPSRAGFAGVSYCAAVENAGARNMDNGVRDQAGKQ